MWFTMLFVIFIIPREIYNIDMQYSMWKFFYMCVLFFKLKINNPILEFDKKIGVSHITHVY